MGRKDAETNAVAKDAEPPSRCIGDPPESQARDHDDQVEDDVLSGDGYDIVLTAPPREIIPCVARIVSIVRGREDLPMSDEDWRSLLLEDDED